MSENNTMVPVVAANPITTDPANGNPVHGNPHFDERIVYPAVCTEPESVEPEAARWNLGFGACLSFGAEEDGEPLTVTLNVSDYTLATGRLQRTVTREQVVEHARHLLRLVGAEPAIVLPEVTS